MPSVPRHSNPLNAWSAIRVLLGLAVIFAYHHHEQPAHSQSPDNVEWRPYEIYTKTGSVLGIYSGDVLVRGKRIESEPIPPRKLSSMTRTFRIRNGTIRMLREIPGVSFWDREQDFNFVVPDLFASPPQLTLSNESGAQGQWELVDDKVPHTKLTAPFNKKSTYIKFARPNKPDLWVSVSRTGVPYRDVDVSVMMHPLILSEDKKEVFHISGYRPD